MGIALAGAANTLPGCVRRPGVAYTYSYTLRSLAASWPRALLPTFRGCALKGAAAQASHRITADACTSCCIVIQCYLIRRDLQIHVSPWALSDPPASYPSA